MLIWIFLGMSVVAALGFGIALKRMDGGAGTNLTKTPTTKKGKKRTSDLWGIKTVEKGILCLENGNYNLICRLSAANYWLLSEQERGSIESTVTSVLRQIHFPIKIIYTTQTVNTRQITDELRQSAPLTPILGEFARKKADFLEAVMADRAAHARYAYLVIPYTTDNGLEHAYAELHARLFNLEGGLRKARLKTEVLDSLAILDLLGYLLCPYALLSPSQAYLSGGTANFVIKEKEVLFNAV